MPAAESLVHRFFDRAFNQGDLAIVDELVAAGSGARTVSWGLPAGRMGLKQLIVAFRLAFPDLHCTVEDEIHTEDGFAARWTMHGTHRGPFLGNPATARPVLVQGIFFARTAAGRIVQDFILVDQMGLLQQLGLVPPPGGMRLQED